MAELVVVLLGFGVLFIGLLGVQWVVHLRGLVDQAAVDVEGRLPFLEFRVLLVGVQLFVDRIRCFVVVVVSVCIIVKIVPFHRLPMPLQPPHNLLNPMPRITTMQVTSLNQHLRGPRGLEHPFLPLISRRPWKRLLLIGRFE